MLWLLISTLQGYDGSPETEPGFALVAEGSQPQTLDPKPCTVLGLRALNPKL